MVDMGVPAYLVASSVIAILAGMLLPAELIRLVVHVIAAAPRDGLATLLHRLLEHLVVIF